MRSTFLYNKIYLESQWFIKSSARFIFTYLSKFNLLPTYTRYTQFHGLVNNLRQSDLF